MPGSRRRPARADRRPGGRRAARARAGSPARARPAAGCRRLAPPARAAPRRRPGGRRLGSHRQPAQRPRHLEAADLEAAAVLPEQHLGLGAIARARHLEAADLEAAADEPGARSPILPSCAPSGCIGGAWGCMGSGPRWTSCPSSTARPGQSCQEAAAVLPEQHLGLGAIARARHLEAAEQPAPRWERRQPVGLCRVGRPTSCQPM